MSKGLCVRWSLRLRTCVSLSQSSPLLVWKACAWSRGEAEARGETRDFKWAAGGGAKRQLIFWRAKARALGAGYVRARTWNSCAEHLLRVLERMKRRPDAIRVVQRVFRPRGRPGPFRGRAP